MKTPKVCIGCFSEWDEEKDACPHCGWSPERVYSEMFQWKTGDVLEKRYLVGEIFCRNGDVAVWRFYDSVLRLSCFALRKVQNIREELYPIARKLSCSGDTEGREIEVLAVKTICGKHVLVFSLKNRYTESEKIKDLLLSESQETGTKTKVSDTVSDIHREQTLSSGTRLDGRYQVKECIGIGGFGITYLCEDIFLHRNVAVKEYFPAEWAERDGEYVTVKSSGMVDAYRYGMQSFFKEMCITAKFIHVPNIVTLYDVFEANDTAYMVMEYVKGISIGRELRAREYKPYTPTQMAEIILPVLDGLEEIHGQKIVHSDISPGNIMRSEKGDICLIDMGAAKYNLETQPALSAAFLKIDYASPEQYRTAKEGIPKDEGPWTDIYGLGATMYYMLTGHKPTDVIRRLSGNPKLVWPWKYRVRLSKKWMKLIRHAMELERKERISSVSELRDEIKKLLK